eukprot:TRINITY_DN3287_c0_g2_i1.p1 TRINITY_DN3287_c0_g2~~TRINITY_DN3287_c0_g2_i1.p1  ORF type:complete len:1043 (+),score=266.99 TRINITY_DN3287_c0_g2_i1:3-3131(+)
MLIQLYNNNKDDEEGFYIVFDHLFLLYFRILNITYLFEVLYEKYKDKYINEVFYTLIQQLYDICFQLLNINFDIDYSFLELANIDQLLDFHHILDQIEFLFRSVYLDLFSEKFRRKIEEKVEELSLINHKLVLEMFVEEEMFMQFQSFFDTQKSNHMKELDAIYEQVLNDVEMEHNPYDLTLDWNRISINPSSKQVYYYNDEVILRLLLNERQLKFIYSIYDASIDSIGEIVGIVQNEGLCTIIGSGLEAEKFSKGEFWGKSGDVYSVWTKYSFNLLDISRSLSVRKKISFLKDISIAVQFYQSIGIEIPEITKDDVFLDGDQVVLLPNFSRDSEDWMLDTANNDWLATNDSQDFLGEGHYVWAVGTFFLKLMTSKTYQIENNIVGYEYMKSCFCNSVIDRPVLNEIISYFSLIESILDENVHLSDTLKLNKSISALHAKPNAHFDLSMILVPDGFEEFEHEVDKRGMSLLHRCACDGDFEVMKVCIKAVSNGNTDSLNNMDKQGWTALHHACATGNLTIVQLLLNYGALHDIKNFQGSYPIHCAAFTGHKLIIEELLFSGVDINLQREDGTSPLFFSIFNNQLETVEFLLSQGCEVNFMSAFDVSPLALAVFKGHLDIVKLLLEDNHTNINVVDSNKISPFYIACQKNDVSIVELFCQNSHLNINIQRDNGCTPIFIACQLGHLEIVKLLLQYGADFNLVKDDMTSPISIAAQEGHDSIVDLLCKAGANVNLCDTFGFSPIYVATQNNHIKVVEILLNNGANVDILNKLSITPLFIACQENFKEIALLLIKFGANLHQKCHNENTPFTIAILQDHYSLIEELMNYTLLSSRQENLNQLRRSKSTDLLMLRQICDNGKKETIEYLINKGLDLNITDENGLSVLFLAVIDGNLEFVKYLVENGANIELQDKNGLSPLATAVFYGDIAITRFLLSSGAKYKGLNIKGGTTLLHFVARFGYLGIAKLLLQKYDLFVNSFDDRKQTPIFIAAEAGHGGCVRMLMDYNADLFLLRDDGESCLSIAKKNGHTHIVKIIETNKTTKHFP